MRKTLFSALFSICVLLSTAAFAQIGIGTTTPDASAVLDLAGNNRGFLVPRMASAERTTIVAPAKGLLVFDNDSSYFFYFTGSVWRSLRTIGVQSPWSRTG